MSLLLGGILGAILSGIELDEILRHTDAIAVGAADWERCDGRSQPSRPRIRSRCGWLQWAQHPRQRTHAGNQVLVGSVNSARDHFQRAIDDLSQASLRWRPQLHELMTHYPRADFATALHDRASDEIKVVIDWTAVWP